MSPPPAPRDRVIGRSPGQGRSRPGRRWALVVLAPAVLLLGACGGDSDPDPRSFAGSMQVPLETGELDQLILNVQTVLGSPYVWGGDDPESGFDCSGLVQWGFRQMGFGDFRYGDAIYPEITAHDLYHSNTQPVADMDGMKRGYFIFFDENGDGRISHNAIFDYVDDQGRIWVYDAYSTWGVVAHRYVEDFSNKGPLLGRPLKTVPR